MTNRCTITAAAFAWLLSAGCLDWDRLRGSPAALMAQDAGSDAMPDGQASDLDPLIEWDFARFSEGVVTDFSTKPLIFAWHLRRFLRVS